MPCILCTFAHSDLSLHGKGWVKYKYKYTRSTEYNSSVMQLSCLSEYNTKHSKGVIMRLSCRLTAFTLMGLVDARSQDKWSAGSEEQQEQQQKNSRQAGKFLQPAWGSSSFQWVAGFVSLVLWLVGPASKWQIHLKSCVYKRGLCLNTDLVSTILRRVLYFSESVKMELGWRVDPTSLAANQDMW